MNILYTPNLGWGVAVPGREREQSRFRGSTEGARGSIEGARGASPYSSVLHKVLSLAEAEEKIDLLSLECQAVSMHARARMINNQYLSILSEMHHVPEN